MKQLEANSRGITKERVRLLYRIEALLETPMVFLGLLWLVFSVIELINGLSKELQFVNDFIWCIFLLDFFVKLVIAPKKKIFFKKNWLLIISLFLPFLRVFRLARAVSLIRLARGARLVRILSSISRSLKSLQYALKKRGFMYVLGSYIIVLFAGAAGMYSFEKGSGAITDYGSALWWTSMILTTMGTDYWPQTLEGRILCWLLSLYSFTIFGYVTAFLATSFLGHEQE